MRVEKATTTGSQKQPPTDRTLTMPSNSAGRPQADETPMPGMTGPQEIPSTSGTHTCGGCSARWSGVSRCHCAGCHRTFGGIGLFDRHRRERRGASICADPATIVGRDGNREMYLTNGLWQGVENPAPRTAPRKAVHETI